MMAKIARLEPRQVFRGLGGGTDGGWSRVVELDDGRRFRVTVTRGDRVRIAFKPRDHGGFGFKWHGRVFKLTAPPKEARDIFAPALAVEIWHGEVGKSIGARGLLTYAGLIEKGKSPKEVIRESRRRAWHAFKHLPKLETLSYAEPWPGEPWIPSACGSGSETADAFTLDPDTITCSGCKERVQQAVIQISLAETA